MSEYVTVLREQHLINNTGEITDSFYDDFKKGLDEYCRLKKKFNQIVHILNDGINKIEFEEEVDPFSENKSEFFVRGFVENNVGEYKAGTEMLYTACLEQITQEEYEKRKIIYVFYRRNITNDETVIDEEMTFDTFEEAKAEFEKYYPDYKKILEVIRNTCAGHSLCEDEHINYNNENLDAFVEALIIEDSELYKADTNMLYHIGVYPERKDEYEEYKNQPEPNEVEQPEELPFK